MKGLDETPQSTLADCYKYTSDGWVKFSTMTKPRAFAASAWVNISTCKFKPIQKINKKMSNIFICQVPRRGWWVTGGMNAFERDGISTTDLFNTGEDASDEVKNKSFIGLILPISDAQIPGFFIVPGFFPTAVRS